MKNHGATESLVEATTGCVVGVVGGLVAVVVGAAAVVVVEGEVVVAEAIVEVVEVSPTVIDVSAGCCAVVVVVSAPGGVTALVPQAAASRVRLRITAPERFIASPFRKCQQWFRPETARSASTGDSDSSVS
jgi:hypothetical protein